MTKSKGTGKLFDQVQDALNGGLHADARVIPSGDRLTVETIADFAENIRRGLAEANTVIIEFAEDVDLDITALQVFCSACQTAAAAGKQFLYRGPLPDTLLHLAATAGSERHDYCKTNNPSCFRLFGGSK